MPTRHVPNPKADAKKVFKVLKDGGIAIIPMNVGYGIIATDPAALDCIIDAKRRKPHKRHAIIGSYSLHCELHILPPREASIVKLLTVDLDLPIGVVAPYRHDHPMIQRLAPDHLDRTVLDETLAILVNAGELAEEVSRLASIEELVVMGSSANITGKGAKIVVDDIEAEILKVADIVIDYGKQKFHHPRASSTMIDFRKIDVLRCGACYDVIQDSLWRFCGIKLPDDPQDPVNISGGTSVR
ncbi:uncharacterized protein N7506_007536 [Penicillium brevicompactum]|uniref:uncharacterized protein n=1 Tax=Penicillium brevicompactum TaxID=5074 RepID=UPI00253FBCE4|nr:uncharacterized protein N7506_007536 [Penicillium brevicompactum]KAJ5333753.1 hypothetical protein N7506_007536 [Penicillium brevicompactum]